MALRCLQLGFERGVNELSQEIKKIVLFESFLHFVVFIQIRAKDDLERIAIVRFDNKK
jgi:hypothetical protein